MPESHETHFSPEGYEHPGPRSGCGLCALALKRMKRQR